MRQLVQSVVKKGKRKGRVCLTLETEDGVFQAWLDRGQAERLAADIFTVRFDLEGVVHVNRPPQWRATPKEVFISFRTTMPRELGERPFGYGDLSHRKELKPFLPEIEKERTKFDRKAAKKMAKRQAELDELVGGGLLPKKRKTSGAKP